MDTTQPAQKNCEGCVKNGLPVRRETQTFLVLLFFITTLIMFVLYVNVKREVASTPKAPPQTTTTTAPKAAAAMISPMPPVAHTTINLPAPKKSGAMSVEEALSKRRSRRAYSEVSVTAADIGQMLWSAQGISDPATGKRTAPSSREAYPFTIFVVVRKADGIAPGFYEYAPKSHALINYEVGNAGDILSTTGVQEGAQKAPVVFLIAASEWKGYQILKASTEKSILLEAGHIGENMYLQAEALKKALVVMAGFDSTKVVTGLKMDPAYTVHYVVPFGNPGVEAEAE